MRLDDLQGDLCAWCDRGFESPYTVQKYCCNRCRKAAENARRTAAYRAAASGDNSGLTCPQCRSRFDAKNRAQKYCCRSCQVQSRNDRRRGKPLAEALADLRCSDCGGQMPHAARCNSMRCLPCNRIIRRKRNRERERIRRAKRRMIAAQDFGHCADMKCRHRVRRLQALRRY